MTTHFHSVRRLRMYRECTSVSFPMSMHINGAYKASGVPRGEGFGGGSNPRPPNSQVLKKLNQIPSSVENTSVTV
jgi:hypothetical protein